MATITRWTWLAARSLPNTLNGRDGAVIEVDWRIDAWNEGVETRRGTVTGTAELPAPNASGPYVALSDVTRAQMIDWAKASYPDGGISHEQAAISAITAPPPDKLPVTPAA